jgi:chromosomal replication initiation ATPase DnaA
MRFVQVLESSRWPGPGFADPGDDTQRVCRLMEAAIAAAFAVSVDELRSHSRRTQSVAFARQSAMYLAHVVLGLNYSATGLLFSRDRTTAAHACQVVEDRRDDPAIDRLLQQLEGICNDLARGMDARFEVQ